jgi:luciferase family oxidoreductase group 1
MLPNHSPLVIAEQFGTLETLHPGRIDLGLGRAPGGDMDTVRALRRYAASADEFPRDVVELQGYLSDRSRMPGVEATPGQGTRVPLFILGSSLFGAELAAAMGLPYAFASHFAPDALEEAVALYRREFRPSEQLREPYVIAGLTVTAADDAETARAHRRATMRLRVGLFLGKGRTFSDAEADALLESPAGQGISRMGRYWACGTAEEVGKYAREFARHAQADELITVHACLGVEERLRSLELFAEAMGLGAERAPRASSMSTG